MRVLLAVEVVFVLVFLAGIALMYIPAALMVGGVLGVVAVERATSRAARKLAPVTELRERRAA